MNPQEFRKIMSGKYQQRLQFFRTVAKDSRLTIQVLQKYATQDPPMTMTEAAREFEIELNEVQSGILALETGKFIGFSREQAQIFRGLADSYWESVEYRLPFDRTNLIFSHPVQVEAEGESDEIAALFLEQMEITQEIANMVNNYKGQLEEHHSLLEVDSLQEHLGKLYNVALIVFADWNMRKINWISGPESTILQASEDLPIGWAKIWQQARSLAIACIGYINCENVYLHKEGEVPDAINRKRERKGKVRLEPYYVCRILGVNYDSHETGTGAAHGHRYDVRGHFRRLDSGKVTWVRPHQRGLANELYIPKTYVVDKKIPTP